MKLSDEPHALFSLVNAANNLNSVLTKGGMGRDYDVKKMWMKTGKTILKAFGIHIGLLSDLTSPSHHLQKPVRAVRATAQPFLCSGNGVLRTWQFRNRAVGHAAFLIGLIHQVPTCSCGSCHILNPSSAAASLERKWRWLASRPSGRR